MPQRFISVWLYWGWVVWKTNALPEKVAAKLCPVLHADVLNRHELAAHWHILMGRTTAHGK